MMSFSNPLAGREQPKRPEQPCAACGQPATEGADVDRNDGRGFVRVPVCDVGCLNELMHQWGGGSGSQLRSRYPSAED